MSVSSHTSKELSVEEFPVSQVTLSGDGQEFVILGNRKYYRHELFEAFGSTLITGLSAPKKREFGNPSPLGLCAFALTTFVLSLINAQAMGIEVPNIVIGLAVFYGGATQFAAGIWEGLVGNTFAFCALTSYGSFWLAFAAVHIKAFGIVAAYEDKDELHNAVSFFLLGWTIFTFILTLATLKTSVAFFSLFVCLTITFAFLFAGDFTGKVSLTRTGGVFGVITAFIAFYNAFAATSTKLNSYIRANTIKLPWMR